MPDTTTTAPSVTLADGAEKYIGTPYVLGSNDPKKGLDCSGFVGLVAKDMGLNFNGDFNGFPTVAMLINKFTQSYPENIPAAPGGGTWGTDMSKIQRGDIITWRAGNGGATTNHVAIYMGAGKIVSALDQPGGVQETNLTDIKATPTGWLRPASNPANNIVPHSLADWKRQFDPQDWGGDPNYKIDANDIAQLGVLIPTDTTGKADFLATLKPGMTLNDIILPEGIANDMTSAQKKSGFQNWWGGTDKDQGGALGETPISDIAGLLGKLTNASNWLHLGAMLAGAGLIGFGLWTITKDLGDTGPQGLVSPMPIILKEGA
jgi:hypothetical protein